MQVATPRTTQDGLTAEQIKRAEEDFHALKKSKAVSDNAYLIHGRRPLLVVFAIRPKVDNTAELVINAVGSEDGDDRRLTSTAELTNILQKSDDDTRFKFVLPTNAHRSIKLNDIKNFFVCTKVVECQIWDIKRIFDVYSSMQVREAVTINFGDGFPNR